MARMNHRLYKEAGIRIQTLRVKQGYTRENLAEMANISDKFLYEMETGRKGFSAEILHRVAGALHVSCDYILTGTRIGQNMDQELAGAIELFDDRQVEKLIRLLEIVYEFGI